MEKEVMSFTQDSKSKILINNSNTGVRSILFQEWTRQVWVKK